MRWFPPSRRQAQLDRIETKIDGLTTKVAAVLVVEGRTKMTVDELVAHVSNIENAGDASVALLQKLADMLKANANDPAAIQAIADRLDGEAQKITDAVNTYTPPTP